MKYSAATSRQAHGDVHFVILETYTGQRVSMCECPTLEAAEREAHRMNVRDMNDHRSERPTAYYGQRRSVRYFEPDLNA